MVACSSCAFWGCEFPRWGEVCRAAHDRSGVQGGLAKMEVAGSLELSWGEGPHECGTWALLTPGIP